MFLKYWVKAYASHASHHLKVTLDSDPLELEGSEFLQDNNPQVCLKYVIWLPVATLLWDVANRDGWSQWLLRLWPDVTQGR